MGVTKIHNAMKNFSIPLIFNARIMSSFSAGQQAVTSDSNSRQSRKKDFNKEVIHQQPQLISLRPSFHRSPSCVTMLYNRSPLPLSPYASTNTCHIIILTSYEKVLCMYQSFWKESEKFDLQKLKPWRGWVASEGWGH